MLHGGVPPAQALLGERRGGEQVGVVGRDLEAGLEGRERLGVVGPRPSRSSCRGPVAPRAGRARGDGPLGGAPGRVGAGRVRRDVVVVESRAPGELGPGQREGGVERHRLLVVRDRAPKARRIGDHEALGRLAFEERVVRRQVARSAARSASASAPSPSATFSADATWPAMSACTWNTSVIAASNGCCHLVRGAWPGVTSTSSGLTRTRLVPSGQLLPLHRGREQVVRPQLAGDLLRRLGGAAVLVGAAAGDDLQVGRAATACRAARW